MFVDTHAHLTDLSLEPKQDEIIKNMQKDNLKAIINVGFSVSNSQKNVELAQKHKNIFAVVGIHPSDISAWNDEIEKELTFFASNKKVLAIGEIGLDYHYEGFDKENQKNFFSEQIKLADRLALPIVVHLRDAEEDCKNLLFKNKQFLNNGVLFHCFCASLDFLNFVQKEFKNVFFAFGGMLTFKKNEHITELLKNCSLNSILFETDCPYLTPEPVRKCINEPKHVSLVYEKASEILGIAKIQLEEIVEKNAKAFFGEKFNV